MPIEILRRRATSWQPYRFGGTTVPVSADRSGLQAGVHKPDATNTGPYTVSSFTDVYPSGSSNVVTLTAGVYKGLRIWGQVKGSGGTVHLQECLIAGPDPDSWTKTGGAGQTSLGCVQNYGSNPLPIWLDDCRIDPSLWLTAAAPGGARAGLNPYNIGWHGGQGRFLRSVK